MAKNIIAQLEPLFKEQDYQTQCLELLVQQLMLNNEYLKTKCFKWLNGVLDNHQDPNDE